MGSSHKRYSREFKLEVVRRVLVTGQRQIGVAEELGIAPNTLSHWMRQFRDEKAARMAGMDPSQNIAYIKAGRC